MIRTLTIIIAATIPCAAAVVRPAPNISWQSGGRTFSLQKLRGQPVVLLVADSPRRRAFRAQAKKLEEIYHQFASRGVVFIAAFTEPDGRVPSNIPFMVIRDGGRVAGALDADEPFNVFIIGKDGNIDLRSRKVQSAARVRDVIASSYAVQAPARATQ